MYVLKNIEFILEEIIKRVTYDTKDLVESINERSMKVSQKL